MGSGPDTLHESYPFIPTDSLGYRLFTTKNWDYPGLMLPNSTLQNDSWEFFLPWIFHKWAECVIDVLYFVKSLFSVEILKFQDVLYYFILSAMW